MEAIKLCWFFLFSDVMEPGIITRANLISCFLMKNKNGLCGLVKGWSLSSDCTKWTSLLDMRKFIDYIRNVSIDFIESNIITFFFAICHWRASQLIVIKSVVLWVFVSIQLSFWRLTWLTGTAESYFIMFYLFPELRSENNEKGERCEHPSMIPVVTYQWHQTASCQLRIGWGLNF